MICLLWADSVEVRYFVVVSGWQWFGVIWIESHAQLSKDLESTHRSVYTWIETWVTLNDTQKGEPYIVRKYDIHLAMFAFSLHLVMMKDITMFLCKIRLIKAQTRPDNLWRQFIWLLHAIYKECAHRFNIWHVCSLLVAETCTPHVKILWLPGY